MSDMLTPVELATTRSGAFRDHSNDVGCSCWPDPFWGSCVNGRSRGLLPGGRVTIIERGDNVITPCWCDLCASRSVSLWQCGGWDCGHSGRRWLLDCDEHRLCCCMWRRPIFGRANRSECSDSRYCRDVGWRGVLPRRLRWWHLHLRRRSVPRFDGIDPPQQASGRDDRRSSNRRLLVGGN
jgi:hypothetical protein